MGNPKYIDQGLYNTATYSVESPTMTVGIPSTTRTKDLLLMVCQSFDEQISSPSGWNEIGDQSLQSYSTTPKTRLAVFYKFANRSDANQNVTINTNNDHTLAQILLFRGVDRLGFSSTTNYSSFSGITTIGSGQLSDPYVLDINSDVTPTRTDCLVVVMGAMSRSFSSINNFSIPKNTNLTSIQRLTDVSVSQGSGGGIFAWAGDNDQLNTVGLTTAVYTPTPSSVISYGTLVLNLRPHRNLTSFS